MRIKLTPVTESNPRHIFEVVAEGYYGDMDATDSFVMKFEVDTLLDSQLLEKIFDTFQELVGVLSDDYDETTIPHWDEFNLEENIPSDYEHFAQMVNIQDFTVYYYDGNGNKFFVTPYTEQR